MTIKTFLTAAALTVLPALGYACPAHSNQAQSCAPGTVWDAAQEACVKQANS